MLARKSCKLSYCEQLKLHEQLDEAIEKISFRLGYTSRIKVPFWWMSNSKVWPMIMVVEQLGEMEAETVMLNIEWCTQDKILKLTTNW